jgi:uncharacterized membrane protein
MKKGVLASFQENLIRGVLLFAPIMVFGILIAKAIGLLRKLVEPFAGPMGSMAGIPMPALLATAVLVLLCSLAGLLAKSRNARGLVGWIESHVLTHIPGYDYMKGMGENVAGVQGSTAYQPVLARIEDSWQLGFIVETIEPGQFAVYVPGAPSPWSGSVYFMAEDRIRRVDMKISEVQGCLKRLGIGSSALLRGKLGFTSAPQP